MAKTVFILGAGASKEDGVPVMDEFLDYAYKLKDSEQEFKADFDRVFNAVNKLKATHYKSYIDLDNIEEVFGAFEMARIIKRLGDYTQDDIEKISQSIRIVIVKTLESVIKLPYRDKHVYSTPVYGEFTTLIKDTRPKLDCSILTFNYDIGLDYAFHFYGIPINYCLSESDKSAGIKFLKLHGSLNWGKCECGAIVPWYLSNFFSNHNFPTWHESKYFTLNIGTFIGQLKHCDKKIITEPVLIPPTWNKTEYSNEISRIWTQAAIELSEAENIFIIGYSMPESDLFFRYLFALGTASDIRLERLWIFNPDINGNVQKRTDNIKGSGIDRRYRFIKEPFSSAIATIRKELKLSDNA